MQYIAITDIWTSDRDFTGDFRLLFCAWLEDNTLDPLQPSVYILAQIKRILYLHLF